MYPSRTTPLTLVPQSSVSDKTSLFCVLCRSLHALKLSLSHRPGVLRFHTCSGRILITSLISLSLSVRPFCGIPLHTPLTCASLSWIWMSLLPSRLDISLFDTHCDCTIRFNFYHSFI